VTKRILHIAASLEPSGTTKQLELLAAGLPRQEFEMQIVSLSRNELPQANSSSMASNPR
jgi:hypothetical protein